MKYINIKLQKNKKKPSSSNYRTPCSYKWFEQESSNKETNQFQINTNINKLTHGSEILIYLEHLDM